MVARSAMAAGSACLSATDRLLLLGEREDDDDAAGRGVSAGHGDSKVCRENMRCARL